MRVKKLSIQNGEKVHISNYPNFHKSGSIVGMKKIYGSNSLLVRCGDYIYNVSEKPEIYDIAE